MPHRQRSDDRIFAFAHVPKTAGMTMQYLLRRNFGLRHLDVGYRSRVLRYYGPRDLRFDLRFYPRVQSLAGHSLKPFVDFEEFAPRMWWYTILRDPVKRFISHYQHEVEKGGKTHEFQDWMRTFQRHNWHVRMFAGGEDLNEAKRVLAETMQFVGLMEQFDASLLLLRRRLELPGFDVRYERKVNTARRGAVRRQILDRFDEYRDAVMEHNALDVQLYEWARENLWSEQVEDYGGAEALQRDLDRQMTPRPATVSERVRLLGVLAYRNVVFKPFLAWDRRRVVRTETDAACAGA